MSRTAGQRPSLHVVVAALALALVGGAPLAPSAAAEAAVERWFVTTIADRPVGSMRETVTAREDGTVTESEVRIVINRMGSRVALSWSTLLREDGEGRLVGFEHELVASAQERRTRGTVEGDALVVEDLAGEGFRRTLAVEGELLGPEGVRRASVRGLEREGDRIDYAVYSPELGLVTGVSRVVEGRETLPAPGGGEVETLRVTERWSESPLVTTLWLDPGGRPVRFEQPGPFGPTATFLADRTAAEAAAAGGELPEESFASSLVPTGIRIPDPRRLDRLELRLRHRNPQLGWPELEGPGQRVVAADEESLELIVERSEPARGLAFPVAASDELAPYLEANAYVRSDHADIVATARELVAGEEDLVAAMERLERWVAESLTFDMGVVMAPADEIFRDRRGTCTEYAVLLTALARAVGIPARVAMGYVYVAGAFGGHAWTEVLAGEAWIPFDAAIVARGPADAGRFAFQWDSLAGGIGGLGGGAAVQMYGQIDLEVVAFRHAGGELRRVPEGAPRHELEGDTYRDPWLGIELARPRGFRFVDLDLTWPEAVLVGLEGPGGERVALGSRPLAWWRSPAEAAGEQLRRLVPGGEAATVETGAGRAPARLGERRAALVVPDSDELWVLEVEGPGAAGLLRRLAAGLVVATSGSVVSSEVAAGG